jgi:hypothetical protein
VSLPDRRHRSRTLRVAARTVDWRDGERFERDTIVEIQAEQWRHPHRALALGLVSARARPTRLTDIVLPAPSDPRRRHVPASPRPRWLTEAVRAARNLASPAEPAPARAT